MQETFSNFENITFGAWLAYWYETYKVPYLKAYSLRNIEQQIRLHTPDWLKEKRITEITVFDVDKALSKIPFGRTYAYTRQVWHSSLCKAEKLGLIKRNVITLTDKISYRKKKGKALSLTEQEVLIKSLENRRYKWIILFYLHTGVRRCEALTLEWNDIDENSGLILIKGTKTEESYRHILLTNEVKIILQEQRKQNEKRGIKGNFVFPFSKQQVSKTFKMLCPSHCLHDLRHTYITRCAESGVNVVVCQQLVGHSTSDTTMNIYTHVLDEFKRKEALKFTITPKL